MEHLTLKAVTTAQDQDQGVFTAVISTSSIDREKDVVDPAGMVAALQKWTSTGKQIPLAWNHSTAADQIIGSIDPASAKDVNGEVVVDGRIDRETDTGAHAWRLVKAGVVGFSFGYLILKGSPRKGGGRAISELDVFEITATPTPMNNDTRVLDYKGQLQTTNEARATIDFPPRDQSAEPSTALNPEKKTLEQQVAELAAVVAEMKALTEQYAAKAVDETDEATRPRAVDPLRIKADAVALEVLSGGESLRKPPRRKSPTPAAPRLTTAELRQQMHQATLDALIGGKQ